MHYQSFRSYHLLFNLSMLLLHHECHCWQFNSCAQQCCYWFRICGLRSQTTNGNFFLIVMIVIIKCNGGNEMYATTVHSNFQLRYLLLFVGPRHTLDRWALGKQMPDAGLESLMVERHAQAVFAFVLPPCLARIHRYQFKSITFTTSTSNVRAFYRPDTSAHDLLPVCDDEHIGPGIILPYPLLPLETWNWPVSAAVHVGQSV